jgi:hypothetical protein
MHCLSEIAPSREPPEFSQLREHLEGQLKQWLLFECNFEFNDIGCSQLAAEMEFPEQILKDILQKETGNMTMLYLVYNHWILEKIKRPRDRAFAQRSHP